MATLNIRYGGNIVSLPEGVNFSPGNYGTCRLKYRVNSASVGELGLTTNTNAKEYCGLQMRVGGQICYIGRVSTTSYVSGESVDYHGSSMGSRSVSSVSASEYATSNASRSIEYYSSSMSTSTSRYTQVTSTEQVQTNYYTQQVLSKTEYVTYGNGSGNGTASYDPGIGDEGEIDPYNNRTSSTETTRTLSEKILTKSSYKGSWAKVMNGTTQIYKSYGVAMNTGTVGEQRTQSFYSTINYYTNKYTSSEWNTIGQTPSTQTNRNETTNGTMTAKFKPYFKTDSTEATKQTTNSYTSLIAANQTSSFKASTKSYSVKCSITTKYDYSTFTFTTYKHTYSELVKWGQGTASTTYGSYSSRWTYYWISYAMSKASYYSTRTVREYSTRSYTGSTYYSSITRSTSSVSETIHNMNV